jgi:hypothetical protein
MNDTHPGIELRIRTQHGEIVNGRSDELHFELRQMWIASGFTGDEWYPVGGTMLRAVLVEIRAVDVPALPPAPSYPHELFGLGADDAAAALANVEAAELADVDGHALEPGAAAERCCVCGSADVGYHNYREQPFCWPCADGDQVAELADVDQAAELAARGPTELAELERYMTRDDRAELAELTRRLAELERRLEAARANWQAAGYRPAPSPAGLGDGAGGSLTEPVSEPARARRPRPRLNIGVARIARRARFRSGR